MFKQTAIYQSPFYTQFNNRSFRKVRHNNEFTTVISFGLLNDSMFDLSLHFIMSFTYSCSIFIMIYKYVLVLQLEIRFWDWGNAAFFTFTEMKLLGSNIRSFEWKETSRINKWHTLKHRLWVLHLSYTTAVYIPSSASFG